MCPFLAQFKMDKLRSQISAVSEAGGASSARLRKLVGKLPSAQASAMEQVVRAMLRPEYLQSNSDVESRAPSPPSMAALEWRFQSLLVWGPRHIKPARPSSDSTIFTDAGGAAGLIFELPSTNAPSTDLYGRALYRCGPDFPVARQGSGWPQVRILFLPLTSTR